MPDRMPQTSAQVATVLWQVKASTLCNLRCRYCYEWDRLADASRLSLGNWARVFQAMLDYRALRLDSTGIASDIFLTWHGGEPLALPADYVRQVLVLQRNVIGPGALAEGVLVNAAQTNLFRLNDTFDVMVEQGFSFNVSWDGATGVRLDGAGRDSNAAVLENIRTLVAQNVPFGVSVVMGQHNVDHLITIHDRLQGVGVQWLRINPMFEPPDTAPADGLALSADRIAEAIRALMEHRSRTGAELEVSPLDRAARTAQRWKKGTRVSGQGRESFGERRLVVHPDGKLAIQPGPTTPDRLLGDLSTQSMADILASRTYRDSLAEDARKRGDHCGACTYCEACTGLPLVESPLSIRAAPCEIEPQLIAAALDLMSPVDTSVA